MSLQIRFCICNQLGNFIFICSFYLSCLYKKLLILSDNCILLLFCIILIFLC